VVRARLDGAILDGARLDGARLDGANLVGASLVGASLDGASLSGCIGLLSAIQYLETAFEWCDDGMIAYKVFGLHRSPPDGWVIAPGSVLSEVVLAERTTECGCGVNVGTASWIQGVDVSDRAIWRVLIRHRWLPGVVVPYAPNGKVRCERVELVEVVTHKQLAEVVERQEKARS